MGIKAKLLRLILPMFIFYMKDVASIASSTLPLPAVQPDIQHDEQASSQIFVRQQYGATLPQTTTQHPLSMTTMSLEPQTSISVHTVVRNKPVYISSQTVSPLAYGSKEADDSNYSYADEDISEAESTKSLVEPSTKSPRSFWNSQKISLDSRRQNAAKKYPSGYHRQIGGDGRISSKAPAVEFKKRERPKFGSSKKPFVVTYKNKATEDTTASSVTSTHSTITQSTGKDKSYQSTNIDSNFSGFKTKPNVEPQTSHLKSNDIVVGRIGALPLQQPRAAQTQSQFRQENFVPSAGSQSTKFDDSMHSSVSQQSFAQLPRQNNANSPVTGNVFISATPPKASVHNQQERNNGIAAASNQGTVNQPISTLLSRLGAIRSSGILRNGGGGYLSGGGGHAPAGGGFSVNLGAIPDPITFIFKLLSLIPKPLLNLNSRLFFGIELGSNAGLVSGSPKVG